MFRADITGLPSLGFSNIANLSSHPINWFDVHCVSKFWDPPNKPREPRGLQNKQLKDAELMQGHRKDPTPFSFKVDVINQKVKLSLARSGNN